MCAFVIQFIAYFIYYISIVMKRDDISRIQYAIKYKYSYVFLCYAIKILGMDYAYVQCQGNEARETHTI